MRHPTAHIQKIAGRYCVMIPDLASPIGYSIGGEHALHAIALVDLAAVRERLAVLAEADLRIAAIQAG
jgi:1,4-dihydroxy-2-naphthoyl-CoA synthase